MSRMTETSEKDELRELYQTMILDHNKRPRNFGQLDAPTHHADGHNPLCGDELTVYLALDGDRPRPVLDLTMLPRWYDVNSSLTVYRNGAWTIP